MKTATRTKIEAAADTLGDIANMATPDPAGNDQKLHGATFDSAPPLDHQKEEQPQARSPDDSLDQKIGELLDQIDQGFNADDESNMEKLTIARNCGAMLWELKALVPHGTFKQKLKERFPKVRYSKCNRWMYIARNETNVAEALEKYPDVAWGPKKMIDYLKGVWNPEEEDEDDEDDASGYEGESGVEEAPLFPAKPPTPDAAKPDAESPWVVGALNPELAAVAEAQSQQAVAAGATAGPLVQAVPTPNGQPRSQPGRGSHGARLAGDRTDFEVEVRVGFKLSIPAGITAEAVTEALRSIDNWNIGINTPFSYELSDQGVVVNHVRPWDSIG